MGEGHDDAPFFEKGLCLALGTDSPHHLPVLLRSARVGRLELLVSGAAVAFKLLPLALRCVRCALLISCLGVAPELQQRHTKLFLDGRTKRLVDERVS